MGKPGIGKSHIVRESFTEPIFFKPCNKWWDGYANEIVVVIDDFDLSAACLHHLLKLWADKFYTSGEVKGNTVPINNRLLVITSNYSIEEIFE